MQFFYPAKMEAEFPSVCAALEDLGLTPDEAQRIIDAATTGQTPDLLVEFKGTAYAVTSLVEGRAIRWRAFFEYRQESREDAWSAAEQIGVWLGGDDQGWAIFAWDVPEPTPRK